MMLTDAQRLATEITEENSQIIACAGSGKTTTMVKKIINILSQEELVPQNLVAITYTEKAAASLKQKIYKEYEAKFGNINGLADMYIGTIHGYCLFILQEFSEVYKNFEILNEVQSKLFIKREREKNGLYDAKYYPAKGGPKNLAYKGMGNESLQRSINAYKTFLDISREYGIEKLKNRELVKYIEKYEKTLLDNKYFDFTSILIATLRLLNEHKLDNYIKSTIKHMIIDEYQDINDIQEEIIRYFYNQGTKICVVGDDDQTIYHWRGSNIKYIKEFSSRYDNVKKIDLDVNFRSSKGITELAKQIISNNKNRIKKEMKSNNNQSYDEGDILAIEYETRKEEIDFIINKINQLINSKFVSNGREYGIDLDDIVILVSSVKKIPELIDALEANDIEFIVEGTQRLFEAKEIILLSKTFDLLFNINGSIEVYNDYDIEKVLEEEVFCNFIEKLIEEWKDIICLSDDSIKMALINFIRNYVKSDPYEYTIQENLKHFFIDIGLFEQELNDKILYNWGQFTEIINDFEKINLKMHPWYRMQAFNSFLKQDAPLVYPEGWLSPNFKTIRCLRIMTYHQSKGLEYPVVFMPFLTKDSIFPLKNPGGISLWGIINDDNIKKAYSNDEESYRRLFYVGITRSEKYLFMTRSNAYSDTGKTFYNKAATPFIEAKNSLYVKHEPYLELIYEKSGNKKFSEDEVLSLNYSLLKDLFDCPMKFKMLNIYNFSQPLNIRMGYGKSIHSMLDYIHKNYKHLDLDNSDAIYKIVDDYLHLPYGSPKLQEAMINKARNHLKTYIINNKEKFKHILFSEKIIDFSLNEYLFINGRIDLVRDDLHNTITLVDFKSSSEVLTRQQIKDQLMIYVLGYENLTGEKVDYIESYDFNNSNPTILPVLEEDKIIFEEKLKNCERIIKSGNFEKITDIDKSKDINYCKGIACDLIKHCY